MQIITGNREGVEVMADIRPYVPAFGSDLFDFRGGPLDKSGWYLDADIAPKTILVDGHLYERDIQTFQEVCGDSDDYMNDPEELLVTCYRYRGKQ